MFTDISVNYNIYQGLSDMKVFTIIKENSERLPNKNFIDVNGHPLWWHLLSELDGMDVTVNTDSEKFIKQIIELMILALTDAW